MNIKSKLKKDFKLLFNHRYRFITALFLVWFYRVAFLPADSGGLFAILQTVSILLIYILINKEDIHLYSKFLKVKSTPLKSLFFFYAYATISACWALLPFFAGFLAIQNLILIFFSFWFLRKFKNFEQMEQGFLFFSLSMATVDALIHRVLYDPAFFIHYLQVGSVAAMCFSYSIGEWLNIKGTNKRKKLLRNSMLASLFLLVTSTSSGANASAIAATCVALFFSNNILIALLILLIALILFLNQNIVEQLIFFIMPGKNLEMIKSATGRQELWDTMNMLAAKKPLLGWGYGCIERAATVYGGKPSPDAHNNYLGFYGSLGIVGCIFAGFHFLTTLMFLIRRTYRKGYTGLFAAVVCALVNGYSYGFLSGKACSITLVYFQVIVLSYLYLKIPDYDKN